MKMIAIARAPVPMGHYSQAVVHDGIVYVSGQLAIDPRTRERNGDTIEEQTEQVLRNVSALLLAAGSDINNVLKVTVYISDVALWPMMNRVYASFFGDHRPARSMVPVKELPTGFLVEMDAIGVVTRSEQ